MSDIVRLLERAEEGCEGLKHGYYDLPCVYFLIFLCHDIKNKIDRLFLKKEQNFSRLNKIFLERPQGYWNGRRLLERALAHLERPLANGTPARLSCGPRIVRWQEILSPSYYPLERALAHLERQQGSLAVLVLFVGRRYYLRPIILCNYLERAKRIWNGLTGLRARHSLLPPPCLCAASQKRAKRRFMRHGPEGPILAASHPSVQEG